MFWHLLHIIVSIWFFIRICIADLLCHIKHWLGLAVHRTSLVFWRSSFAVNRSRKSASQRSAFSYVIAIRLKNCVATFSVFQYLLLLLCMEYEVEGSTPRGRPKGMWTEVVQKDCQARNLNRKDGMDRSRWKKLIKIGWWSGWWVDECFFWYRLGLLLLWLLYYYYYYYYYHHFMAVIQDNPC